jgi:predicted Ser/Thr protein kinase
MSTLPQSAADQSRPRIGRYVITGRLGRGGMGMVYEGLDEALERKVAIKTITAEGAVSEESKRRFEVEAKAAARMQHPNIVAVYELGEDRGVQYIAMEFLDGTDLGRLMRSDEELLLVEKLDIAIQVCRGLAYAHERNVWHRDIKPDNIGLLDDGTAKIMDFGIAKMEGTQLTKTGMMVGTVNYMSPEQVRGQKLDGRTDVFSMGVILYQLVSGQRPFPGEGPSQVLYKIVTEPPAPLDLSSLGEAGPRLQEIIERALAKDREKRYQGAGELADDLQKVLDEVRTTTATRPDPGVLQAVATARRTVRDGKVDAAVAQLQTLVTSNPALVEARRELRGALRRQKQRKKKVQASPEEIATELQATFQAPPTRRGTATEVAPTVVVPESAPAPRSRRGIVWGALAAGAVVVGLGVVFLSGVLAPPAPIEVSVPVRSQPRGASVLVDGNETGVVTPGVVVLRSHVPEESETGVVTPGVLVLPSPFPEQVELTFRKPGHRDETRAVSLTPAPTEVSVTLESDVPVAPVRTKPAGATVTLDGERVAGVTPLEIAIDPESEHVLSVALDGYVTREIRVAAGETPEVIEAELKPLPPPGQVSIVSSYPIDVLWRGRVLARGAVSPQVDLQSGQQVLTLVASSIFLRRDVTVSVPAGGQAAIEAPGVGRLSIRAFPDNCEVFVSGTSAGYPPILNREVAAGSHTVSFRWPDGATDEQTVEVQAGRTEYATGRKE